MTNPYEELIQRVEQNIQALNRGNFARDAKRERLERKKILLLSIILAGVWAIFLVLCTRIESPLPVPPPEAEHNIRPPVHYEIRQPGEPVYAI